jgi:hypothetical protein
MSSDSHSPGPSASLTEMKETLEKRERDPDLATGRDIQMK